MENTESLELGLKMTLERYDEEQNRTDILNSRAKSYNRIVLILILT